MGYAESTTLPARDGVPGGEIKRSSRAPNNSFFTDWKRTQDSITWEIDVGETRQYEAIVHYTCRAGDEGATIRLASSTGGSTEATVTEAFDPPLYDKSIERMDESHYFVKDFLPLKLGTLALKKGRATLTLSAPRIPGREAIDVHSVDLIQVR